jgi:hypothetical protein
MKKSSLICLMAVALLCACKKSGNALEAKLTNNKWMRSDNDKNPGSNPSGTSAGPVIVAQVMLCEADDIYNFNSDKYTVDKGENHCIANEEQTVTGDYSLDTDKKELFFGGVPYKVIEITSVQMKLYRLVPTSTGFSGIIFIYKPVK